MKTTTSTETSANTPNFKQNLVSTIFSGIFFTCYAVIWVLAGIGLVSALPIAFLFLPLLVPLFLFGAMPGWLTRQLRQRRYDFIQVDAKSHIPHVVHNETSDLSYSGRRRLSVVEATEPKVAPRVFIVEDDADTANAISAAFSALGCSTTVSKEADSAALGLVRDQPDFVVLDWMLGHNMFGDQVVADSERKIEVDPRLEDYFSNCKTKIVTFSSLEKENIQLPKMQYFEHWDHWQKPMKFRDMTLSAGQLLAANGF